MKRQVRKWAEDRYPEEMKRLPGTGQTVCSW